MTDIKKRLNRLKKIPERLQEIKREIEYLESNPIASQQFENQPRNNSNRNTTEDRTINTIDRLSELKVEFKACLDEQKEMAQGIESLSDPLDNMVIRLFYIDGNSWDEVARSLRVSKATIQRARTRAMEELEELLGG
ncbi:DUF1492 domain-containing protein [Streptococcus danieliae]|uniref:DUF1492 domain-containing protein n=1 Tax=Streptococcus danieliae TaxID=747656 RepID=A0A7X3G6Q0_9STRE|nr:DUF1492 domain-containing protein [Streptococcus danieliae]MBF0699163.1 sigma-70 family RNA polymerase sigma factor [Streptococcus danieliae]MVX58153.1 DUF1492 domain-containing protein [Streptococcus danieliae]NYS96339.1 sigma-70 family RNA polymerase sigma factor [Streptococcus danieliae]